MKKIVLEFIPAVVISIIFTCSLFSFIKWDYRIWNWSEENRLGIILLVFFFAVIIFFAKEIYLQPKEKK